MVIEMIERNSSLLILIPQFRRPLHAEPSKTYLLKKRCLKTKAKVGQNIENVFREHYLLKTIWSSVDLSFCIT